jgi:predicted thioesterase
MSEPCYRDAPPPAGAAGAAELRVAISDTARLAGSGSLEVLATPVLAALMEAAACRAVDAFLAPGWTSVGTRLDLSHLAASPVGALVTAQAVVTAAEGRRIDFELSASDGGGQVGAAVHSRFVVEAERFMAKTARRLPG